MTQAFEPQEDYRARNARLGLAIYVPGKTVEETLAKINAGGTVNLALSKPEAAAIYRAAEEVEYICSAAGHVFAALRLGITAGHMTEGDTGVHGILELCRRGMAHAEEHEGQVLANLAMKMRDLGVKPGEEV